MKLTPGEIKGLPQASKLPPLKWNDVLSKEAQK